MSGGYDSTPEPGFLRAMQNQRWTAHGALSELVDNSFGPGRGDASSVTIIHETQKRIVTVLDNGRGMDAIGRLFRLGNTIGRSPGDIGLYGSGGTMALLWLASRVEIWTLRDGQVSRDELRWQSPERVAPSGFPLISDDWERATIMNTPAELFDLRHGTLIRLHLARERSLQPFQVQRHLAQTYAPALRMGKQLTWRTVGRGGGEVVLADAMADLHLEKWCDIDIHVDVRGELLPVHGRIGLVEGLPTSHSKISVGYGPRVILKTNDCYGSPDGSERFIGTGVTGWIQLGEGWQPYLATTKDAMNDEPAWQILMGYLFEQIKPLLQLVDEQEIFLEFEDLAFNLQEALNGRAHVDVLRAPEPPEREGRASEDGPEDERDEPDRDPPEQEPSDAEGSGATADKRAVAKVSLRPMTDDEMEQELCRVHLLRDTIFVEVNKDHQTVREAIEARPTQRATLNVLVSGELARTLVAPEHAWMLKRIFPPRVVREIDRRDEEGARSRFASRLLLDRVAT